MNAEPKKEKKQVHKKRNLDLSAAGNRLLVPSRLWVIPIAKLKAFPFTQS